MIKMIVLFIQLFVFTLYGENPSLNRSEEIDREIFHIKKEIHELGLKAMKAEVESENHMKYQWSKYTEDIKTAENYDQQMQKLQDKIKALKAEKKAIDGNQKQDIEVKF